MTVWLMQWELGYVSKTAWFGQDMDMLILLWHKAVKVDRFFMEKQGIDKKPSVLTMCNFRDSEINIDWEKKKGPYFLGTLHTYNIVAL